MRRALVWALGVAPRGMPSKQQRQGSLPGLQRPHLTLAPEPSMIKCLFLLKPSQESLFISWHLFCCVVVLKSRSIPLYLPLTVLILSLTEGDPSGNKQRI